MPQPCHIVLYTPANQPPHEKGYKGRRFENGGNNGMRGHDMAIAFAKGVEEAGGHVLGLFRGEPMPLYSHETEPKPWQEPGT